MTGKDGDFLEKYHGSSVSFCLHTFEFIMTVIMMIEYYAEDGEQFKNRTDSYLCSMIILLIYGLITASQNFTLFATASEKIE